MKENSTSPGTTITHVNHFKSTARQVRVRVESQVVQISDSSWTGVESLRLESTSLVRSTGLQVIRIPLARFSRDFELLERDGASTIPGKRKNYEKTYDKHHLLN